MKGGEDVKKRTPNLQKIVCFLIVLCLLLTSIPVWAGELGVVTGNVVNIRSGPGTNNKILTKVKRGESYIVLAQNDGWVKIRLNNGQEGWISGDYFTVQATSGKKLIVQGTVVNLRKGPSTSYARVSQVKKGDILTAVQSKDDWYQVITNNGVQAWIAGWLVVEQKTAPAPTPTPMPTPPPTPTPTPEAQSSQVVVTGNVVNIRSAGDLSAPVLKQVRRGDMLSVLAKSGDWFQVSLGNGSTGWIASWLTTAYNEPAPSRGGGTEVLFAPLSEGKNFRILESAGRPVIALEGWQQNESIATIDKATKTISLQLDGTTNINYNGNLTRLGIQNIKIMPQGNKTLITLVCGFTPGISTEFDTSKNTAYLNIEADMQQSLVGKLIVLDPGHSSIQSGGGLDPGAIGPITRLQERTVNLAVALKLKNLLENAGARVLMTHTYSTNLSLAGRAAVANNNSADIFVSIHADSNNNRGLSGHTTFYYAPASNPVLASQRYNRQKLAIMIQRELVRVVGRQDRGVIERNYAVLRETRVPSVLVETAFLSNPTEEILLGQEPFRQKLAEGIFQGIRAYFEQ